MAFTDISINAHHCSQMLSQIWPISQLRKLRLKQLELCPRSYKFLMVESANWWKKTGLMPKKPMFFPLYHIAILEQNEDSPGGFQLVFWTCLKSLWDVNSVKSCGVWDTWALLHFLLFKLIGTQTSGFPHRNPLLKYLCFLHSEEQISISHARPGSMPISLLQWV